MTVNDTSNAVFAISGLAGHTSRIYVYKYFIRNSRLKAQKERSPAGVTGIWRSADEVLQILCIRETLFVLVRYGTKIFWKKIPVQDRSPEPPTNAPYPVMLDRRISTTTETPTALRVAAGTYNAVTKQTTWTLPFAATTSMQAWSGYSTTGNGGVRLATITSGNVCSR